MFIKLQDLKAKYNLNVRGIVHVGAHTGEEYDDYAACGMRRVLFIEPCYAAYKQLRDKFANMPEVTCLKVASGDYNGEIEINLSSNPPSNSILKPKKHLEQFPNIVFANQELVTVQRLEDTLKLLGDNKSVYNFINMDIQGYELHALRGLGSSLAQFDYIYLEVNTEEVYEGCALLPDVDKFLHEFDRVETNLAGGNWGDAFYVRKNVPATQAQPSHSVNSIAPQIMEEAGAAAIRTKFTDLAAANDRITYLEKRLWRINKILVECGIEIISPFDQAPVKK